MQPALLIIQYKIRTLDHICPAMLSFEHLAHDHTLEAGHVALLSGDFEVSVNDGNGKKDTSSATEGTKKVATNRESTNASTTESGSSGDDALELLVHGLFTVTSHDETLLLELLGDVAGRRARDLDPGLREDGACNEHVDDENGGLERVGEGLSDAEGRGPETIST
jgi:hypothetical protein